MRHIHKKITVTENDDNIVNTHNNDAIISDNNNDNPSKNKFKKIIFTNFENKSTYKLKSQSDGDFNFFPTMLYITIHKNKFNMSRDEIINFISSKELVFVSEEIEQCDSSRQIIFNIPISFFINYSGFIEENNSILIPLDFKMFYTNVIFGAHNFTEIEINNDLEENGLFLSFSMDVEIIKVKEIVGSGKEMLFQYIQTHVVNNINDSVIHENLYNKNSVKGFFIGGDIESIQELKLILNGHNRFIYDEIMINTICTKINEKIMYVPLDTNINYEDCSISSYASSLNMSRIDSVSFNIKFNNVPKNLVIYTLGCNFYKSYNETPFLMFTI